MHGGPGFGGVPDICNLLSSGSDHRAIQSQYFCIQLWCLSRTEINRPSKSNFTHYTFSSDAQCNKGFKYSDTQCNKLKKGLKYSDCTVCQGLEVFAVLVAWHVIGTPLLVKRLRTILVKLSFFQL